MNYFKQSLYMRTRFLNEAEQLDHGAQPQSIYKLDKTHPSFRKNGSYTNIESQSISHCKSSKHSFRNKRILQIKMKLQNKNFYQ